METGTFIELPYFILWAYISADELFLVCQHAPRHHANSDQLPFELFRSSLSKGGTDMPGHT